ncbi:MAG: cell wall hydrolase [Halanaerobacter sp.]
MQYRVIALTLIMMLIAPSLSLFVDEDFSRVYAEGIEGEKAAEGLLISGLLVLLLRKVMNDSERGDRNYSGDDDDKVYWLAKAINAEARGEPFKGQVAVGAVILNRVRSSEFPDTIYSVIHQKGQFSSVKDGQIDLKPSKEAYKAAKESLEGQDPSQNALYFYNPVIAKTLWWLNTRKKTVEIGQHVFAK